MSQLIWHKVAEVNELPDGRVKTVRAADGIFALTHFEGEYAALHNECPHQKGPLGGRSIENGFLRCPWHGWDFHPCSGKPPGGFDDGVATYPVEVRDDGIYLGLEAEEVHLRTISDVMIETMVNWESTPYSEW